MLYNYDYRLPVIRSTYKSNYGKGRDDIIDHNVEYLDLHKYSLRKLNNSIVFYEKLIEKLHKISFSCLITLKEKSDSFKEILLSDLNYIPENKELDELDIVTIEQYFRDRKEKIELVRDRKKFEHDMLLLANKSKRNKKRVNHSIPQITLQS